MEISIYNRTNEDVNRWQKIFEEIAVSAEKKLHLPSTYEISVTFVRSRTIHIINKEYRGIDRPTDVISFAVNDVPELVDLPDKDLGDIFLNIDYARKQAKAYGHSYKREVSFLFTHGLLHCLGYDHMTEEEEKVMFALQNEILDPVVKRV